METFEPLTVEGKIEQLRQTILLGQAEIGAGFEQINAKLDRMHETLDRALAK